MDGLYPAVVGDDDDGTMPNNVAYFAEQIVGHRIVSAAYDRDPSYDEAKLILKLDNGKYVRLFDTSDCCAYTQLVDIIELLPMMDHVITNVTPDLNYNTWHIFCDFGEMMQLHVGWSSGNSFYYGYGFHIQVTE